MLLMKHYAASVLVGGISLVAASVVALAMLYATYGLYTVGDAVHTSAAVRRGLAWLGFVLVAGPAIVVLFALPFVFASRWRVNAIIGLLVAGGVAGLVADRALFEISRINDCALNHAFPYVGVRGCGD